MAPVHNVVIHKHVEFRHMRICADTADYQGTQALFVVNSVKLHLTALVIMMMMISIYISQIHANMIKCALQTNVKQIKHNM